jgi:hypothetical protein
VSGSPVLPGFRTAIEYEWSVRVPTPGGFAAGLRASTQLMIDARWLDAFLLVRRMTAIVGPILVEGEGRRSELTSEI